MTKLQDKKQYREFNDQQRVQREAVGLSVGAALRDEREKAGITLEDAALYIGLTRFALMRLENNANGLTIVQVYQLAEMYNVPLAKLFPNVGKGKSK